MHNEAGERFQRAADQRRAHRGAQPAWFYLAQVWYARGYLDKADAALRKINGRMSPGPGGAEGAAVRQRADARGPLRRGDPRCCPAGAAAPDSGRPTRASISAWRWCAAKRLSDADPFLTGVGTMLAATPELAALRDRANLALGFAYLQAEQPARARPALDARAPQRARTRTRRCSASAGRTRRWGTTRAR